MRNPATELSVPLRMTKEVDHLCQLRLRFVDARHVRERDAVASRLVSACTRAAERSQNVLNVSCSPHQPEQQEDEQDRRAEAEQQVLPPGSARIEGLGVDDDTFLLEQPGQSVVVGERRDLGAEPCRRLRFPVPGLLREGALHRRPLRGDLLDVALTDLLQEEGAVRNPHARRRLRGTRAEVDIEGEEGKREQDPRASGPEARRRPGRRGSPRRRRRGRVLPLVRARNVHCS